MKYMVFDVTSWIDETKQRYVTVFFSEDTTKTFPTDESNPDYVHFLVDAKLTDEEVHALEPDVWYDFPTEETN